MAVDPARVAETSACESNHESSTDVETGTESSSRSLSRRRALSGVAAGSMTALAGCAKIFGSDTTSSDDVLDVCVWSGNYYDRFEESVVPLYEDEYGVDVQLHGGWNDILVDIRQSSGEPPYDVTVADGYFYHVGRQEGLFEPVRTENVPNLDAAIDHYTDLRTTEYGVPVDGAPCNIIYREDMDFEPETWADLGADPVDNSTGIGIDTGFWWFPVHAAAVGMDDRELAGELYEESLHDAVFDELRSWNINSWASSGQDIWQAFDDGTIDVAQWYFEQTAYDIDDHDGIAHTLPEETTGYLNNWCVVDGTERRDQAEEFLDFLLSAETQTAWSESSPALFCNAEMEYANGLGEQLPTTSEEAQRIAFPDWGYLQDYYETFDEEYSSIRTDD